MGDFHFIKDPTALQIIATVLELAGPSFTAPYDSSAQPSDAVSRNNEILTQYDVPGGTSIKGTANPAASPSMGPVISALLTALGPIISAYGFILPIIGVIRGIIEVLCCLMNPFCIIPAMIRLFVKWIPPFISLFPPAAGIVIILSTIKLLLAIVFFILTEVVPTLQLVIANIQLVIDAFAANNVAKAEAGRQKLEALAIDLANRLGIAAVAKPLLDLIFMILGLVSGFPCGGGKKSSKSIDNLGQVPITFDGGILDTNCCGDDMCPPEITSPPSGRALLVPKYYGDAPPLWTWALIPITGKENIPKLRPYIQDMKSQLNPQLDEEIDEAVSAGSTHDAAHFRVRIFGRRGQKFCKPNSIDSGEIGSVVVPIAKLNANSSIVVTNYNLSDFMGIVDYCIEPNYYQLVGRNIIGVGCHPEVASAKKALLDRFDDFELSALDKYPELADIPETYAGMTTGIVECMAPLRTLVVRPIEEFSVGDIDIAQGVQDCLVDLLFGVANKLLDRLNSLLSKMSDRISSSLDVDKNIVRAGATDKAIVSVIPRDVSGTPIARNLPTGADISVDLFTDFGTLRNQSRDNSTGTITAELISPFAGSANVMAKINGEFVSNFDGANESIKVETVRFVADAILPARRTVSKPSSGSRSDTGSPSEREPGSR